MARKILHIKWSFDERVDDGLTSITGIKMFAKILENPFRYIKVTAQQTVASPRE